MKVPGCISVLIVLHTDTLRLIHLIKPRWRTLSLHREVVLKKKKKKAKESRLIQRESNSIIRSSLWPFSPEIR